MDWALCSFSDFLQIQMKCCINTVEAVLGCIANSSNKASEKYKKKNYFEEIWKPFHKKLVWIYLTRAQATMHLMTSQTIIVNNTASDFASFLTDTLLISVCCCHDSCCQALLTILLRGKLWLLSVMIWILLSFLWFYFWCLCSVLSLVELVPCVFPAPLITWSVPPVSLCI